MSAKARSSRFHSELQFYLREINETPLLSLEEERELADQVAQGDPYARDLMVRANLRLVVSIARDYLGKGVSLEDLIAEGNLGLMRAVEGFDGSLDVRFSTYASYWIKQSMRRVVINQGKPLRLPAYMVTLLTKWRRATAALTESLGRAPTPDEVGDALRLSKKKRKVVAQAIRVSSLMACTDESDEDDDYPGQLLADERIKPAADRLVEDDELGRVFQRLEFLDEREAAVIRMRYGLDTNAPMTLREVGEHLGLTRERIRQLEKQALRQLMEAV